MNDELYFVGERRYNDQFHYIVPGKNVRFCYFEIKTGLPIYGKDILGFRRLEDAKKWERGVISNGGWSNIEIFKGTVDGPLYLDEKDDRIFKTIRLKNVMTLKLLDYE